jgi:hypothetical protein
MKLFLSIILTIATASATLVKTDFLNPNDGLIVKDTSTNFEWLTPLYTKGMNRNAPFVQDLIANEGFRYATAAELSFLFQDHFSPAATNYPGDAAGFTAGTKFLSLFGVAFNGISGGVPYQYTVGLSGTSPGNPSTFRQFGFYVSSSGLGVAEIGIGASGGFEGINTHGSFLVRAAAEEAVPEPSTNILLGLSLVLLGSSRRIWPAGNPK